MGDALARKSKIRLAELQNYFFVSFADTSRVGSHQWLGRLSAQEGFKPLVVQAVDTISSALSFVASGLGVAVLPEQVSSHPGVVFRPLEPLATADLCIAWQPYNNSGTLKTFLRMIREQESP